LRMVTPLRSPSGAITLPACSVGVTDVINSPVFAHSVR
jgi:hypothetical protein